MLFVSLAPLSMLAVSLLVATRDSSPSDGARTDPSHEITSSYAETGYRQ
jgi:hypothetical protein